MSAEKKKAIVCGNCVKFHTMACAVESVDSVIYKVFFAEEEDVPFRGDCFESKYKRGKWAKCSHCGQYYPVKHKVEKTVEIQQNGVTVVKTYLACPHCYGIIEKEKETQLAGWSLKRCRDCGAPFLPRECVEVELDGKIRKFCPNCGSLLHV